MAFKGASNEAVEKYVKEMSDSMVRRVSFKDDPEKDICFLEAAVLSPGKGYTEELDISDQIEVELKYRVRRPLEGTNVSMALSRDGIVLLRSWDTDKSPELHVYREAGIYTARIVMPLNIFSPGIYSITVSAGRPGLEASARHADCLFFELKMLKDDVHGTGIYRDTMFAIPLVWNQTLN